MARALIFDLDGTLVDTVYAHVFAWQRALAEEGMPIDGWRIHRRIGMSGGLFTRAVAREVGRELSHEETEAIQARHGAMFRELLPERRPLPGAVKLLADLRARGIVLEDRRANDVLVPTHVYARKPGNTAEASRVRTYPALTAACLLVRKPAFDDVGGFDEGYWNGNEDVDLCFKFQKRGWKLVYQPQSVVIHHESKSGPERYRKAEANGARLQERWHGQIAADVIAEKDGTMRRTDATWVRPYAPPGSEPPRGAAAEAPRLVAEERQPGLVSIVILTCNQLRYTRECVASIDR